MPPVLPGDALVSHAVEEMLLPVNKSLGNHQSLLAPVVLAPDVRIDDIGDAAGMRLQHDDLLGEIERFLDIMGYEEDGEPGLADDLQEEILHLPAGLIIERAEWLIEQQNLRFRRHRPGERHVSLARNQKAYPGQEKSATRTGLGSAALAAPIPIISAIASSVSRRYREFSLDTRRTPIA